MNSNEILKEYAGVVDDNIKTYIPADNVIYNSVINAVEYSLSGGGKHLRASLVLEFCRIFSGTFDDALPAAIAVEMVHTYSLIHDDLPCMDNDDMRRGKPSCHKAFGEDIALLAGDGLQSLAFETLTKCNVSPEKIVKCVSVLAECCGLCGMVGGQVIDLQSEGKSISLDELYLLQKLKTGKMFEASVRIGCILGGASDTDTDSCVKFADNLGLAFQIRDDILDVIGNEEMLGKPIGSDAECLKNTFVSLLSLQEAELLVKKHTELAKEAIAFLGPKGDRLCRLADYLVSRNN